MTVCFWTDNGDARARRWWHVACDEL